MPLKIVRSDITKMDVDAIVNAAKESLLGGGGVDGCIHRAAGPKLLEECRTLGGCKTGNAKITGAYNLPCRYVIHTVGPVWRGGEYGEREKLIACYKNSLALAEKYGCETVAFPLISSGIFGYPKDQALRIAVDIISEFLESSEMTVYIAIFDKSAYNIESSLFCTIDEYIKDNETAHLFKHYDHLLCSESVCAAPSASSDCDMIADVFKNRSNLFDDGISFEEDYKDTSAKIYLSHFQKSIPKELEETLKNSDAGFSEMLMKLIDRTGKKDSEIYKKANIDRRLFSKIRSNPEYKPSKQTALAFAIALELNLDETRDLISRAGFTLTHSSKFDIIVEYFILQKDYNIFHINEALFAFDQCLLG